MKLCIIGDSHTGALKLGWDKLATGYPDWQCEFYGGHHPLASLSLRDAELVSSDWKARWLFRYTSRGHTSIALSRFGAFAVVGFDLSTRSLIQILSRHRPYELAGPDSEVISASCLRAAIRGAIQTGRALQIARMIRSSSDAPIFLITTPQASEGIIDAAPDTYRRQNLIANPALQTTFYNAYLEASATVEAAEGFRFIQQPAQTLIRDAYTVHHYATSAVGFSGRKREPDMYHMDRDYGAAMMEALFSEVMQQRAERATTDRVESSSRRSDRGDSGYSPSPDPRDNNSGRYSAQQGRSSDINTGNDRSTAREER